MRLFGALLPDGLLESLRVVFKVHQDERLHVLVVRGPRGSGENAVKVLLRIDSGLRHEGLELVRGRLVFGFLRKILVEHLHGEGFGRVCPEDHGKVAGHRLEKGHGAHPRLAFDGAGTGDEGDKEERKEKGKKSLLFHRFTSGIITLLRTEKREKSSPLPLYSIKKGERVVGWNKFLPFSFGEL